MEFSLSTNGIFLYREKTLIFAKKLHKTPHNYPKTPLKS
jgi:hypothetical protein